MAVYTVDTHSLVWHFTQSPKLGENAKNCFASIESGFAIAYVPIIVMAEAFYISRRKRIDFDFEKLLDKILVSPNYFLYPFDYEVFVQIINLEKLSELHDQIIVATTKITSSILITKDEEITNSKLVEVIW